MNPVDRIASWKLHDSMRGHFGFELYKAMAKDDRIWTITCDLGYGLLDAHKEDFPTRFVNCGAAEQLGAGIAIGLAMEGKIPILYSITTFLLFRPFEWIRNYLQHEGIPVRLVGSGFEDDYKHDGITHQPYEAEEVLALFPRINSYWPSRKEEIPDVVDVMIRLNEPSFLCLRR